MDKSELTSLSEVTNTFTLNKQADAFLAGERSTATVEPQCTDGKSCSCRGPSASNQDENASPSYVYVIGRVEMRFPRPSVEKELAQTIGRGETVGLTDHQALYSILSQSNNRYLARQLCWVFTVEGLETYILMPRDPTDFNLLIESVRPSPHPMDVDVVVGVRGPIAPPEMCNGLMIPIVAFDQIYSFDRDSLIKNIPAPTSASRKPRKESSEDEQFRSSAGELFDRVMQITDNAGATDEHRALNYLSVRYPAIYSKTAECQEQNASLSGVEMRPSRLSGVRRIVDVIFSYTNRRTDVTEKFFVRVDVSDEFPFLVTKLSPYIDL